MDKQTRKQISDSYKARRAVGGVFAVRNSANGKSLIQFTTELQGSLNRFQFSKMTGGCSYKVLQEDYQKYGSGAFTIDVLEELVQKEGQTEQDFRHEIEALYEMIISETDASERY